MATFIYLNINTTPKKASAAFYSTKITNGLEYPSSYNCEEPSTIQTSDKTIGNLPINNNILSLNGNGVISYKWDCTLPIDSASTIAPVYCPDIWGTRMHGIYPDGQAPSKNPFSGILDGSNRSDTLPLPGYWGLPDANGVRHLKYSVKFSLDGPVSSPITTVSWEITCQEENGQCKTKIKNIGMNSDDPTAAGSILHIYESTNLTTYHLTYKTHGSALAAGTQDWRSPRDEVYDFYISNPDGTPNPDGTAITAKMKLDSDTYVDSINNIDAMAIVSSTKARTPIQYVSAIVAGAKRKQLNPSFYSRAYKALGEPDGQFASFGGPVSSATFCF